MATTPTIPPVPRPTRPAMTPMEAHYLTALTIWTTHMHRPPLIHELAAYCGRTRTPVYEALIALEHKGYVRRNARRQFEVLP